jgi:hypothetical protein
MKKPILIILALLSAIYLVGCAVSEPQVSGEMRVEYGKSI